MKKNLFIGLSVVAVAILFAACGGSSNLSIATSTSVDLAKSIRYIPTLANLQVAKERVAATCTAAELEGLKKEEMRQAVVARALASVNADVMIAPVFSVEKNEEGKMAKMSVVGYPATFTSFRPMQPKESPFVNTTEVNQDRVSGRMAVNTLTVADVEIGAKKSITLSAADVVGKDQKAALKVAKEKLVRQEKVDFVYEPQYQATIVNGQITKFVLTAFPAKYVNYRPAKKAELEALQPSSKPVVLYNLTADIVPVGNRVQLKASNQDPTAKESELKESVRAAALQKYKADFLLNETFYFDYQEKVVIRTTICGTPAVYANFRPIKEGDVIDVKFMGLKGGEGEDDEPKSFWDSLLKK